MATYIGIGFSQNANPSDAALEAINQAKTQANQLNIHMAIVFSTIHYSRLETSALLRQYLPNTKIIGASTAGIILPDFIANRGIAVVVINSDQLKFGLGAARDLDSSDPRQAGAAIGRDAIADFGHHRRQVFVLFSDGLLKNSSALLSGLQQTLGTAFPVIGAGSSDSFHYKKNYQYFQDKFMSSSACGFLIGGQVNIGFGSSHGWKPLGKPRHITKTEGTAIRAIDGQKASHIYEDFFGKDFKTWPAARRRDIATVYPLGIYLAQERQYLLRNAVDIESDGSIICQGDVPEGSEVHLMIGNKDYCREAAIEAAHKASEGLYGKQPKLVLIFESLARQKLLGRHAIHEIQAIREVFGNTAPTVGMYCHGEMTPHLSPDGTVRTHLQNGSIVVLAID